MVADSNFGHIHGMTDQELHSIQKMAAEVHMAKVESSESLSSTLLRMALQAPSRFRTAMKKESTFRVVCDSGASLSVSNVRDDFVGPLEKPSTLLQLKGIAKGLRIEGVGHVMWAVPDITGQLRMIKVPAYYVPKCRARLLSTTSFLQTYAGEIITSDANKMTFSGVPNVPTRRAVVAFVDQTN